MNSERINLMKKEKLSKREERQMRVKRIICLVVAGVMILSVLIAAMMAQVY